MFASPLVFPSSLVLARWRWLHGLNPITGVIEGFRWALTGLGRPVDLVILTSAGIVLVMFLGGLIYFNKNGIDHSGCGLDVCIKW
jgi:lipopolysaccharide transport system permease protein